MIFARFWLAAATLIILFPGQAIPKVLAGADYTNHPGFPIYYDRWTEKASVSIADIQNDGDNELLLPTFDGYIFAWNSSGQVLPGFPLSNPGWRIRGRLALADLNHDGDMEIAAGLESASPGIGARIMIWEPDGQVYSGWPQDTACARFDQLCSVAGIILADLDKDSNLEVIAATTNSDLTTSDPSRYVPSVYVWRSNGALAPGIWPMEDEHNVAIIGQMAVGDLDGDEYPDIVTGRDYNHLFAFDRIGANLSGWPHYVWYPIDRNNWTDDQIEFPRSSPALADLNQDGHLEFIIAGHRRHATSATYFESELLVYTASATRFTGWETPASSSAFVSSNTTKMIEAPAVADLTGDGQPEIILATQDGYVRAYTAEKQLLWAYNYAQGQEVHASETVIGDVDGDGWNEVVFGTFSVRLVKTMQVGVYILDHKGIPKAGSPLLAAKSEGISNSPALGDLDGDGLIEIAAATYDGRVYVWDAPGYALPDRLPWPMPRHDLQRTGLYKDTEPNLSQSRKHFDPPAARLGDTVTSTIELVNTGATLKDELQITDVIPAGLSYVPGSLHVSTGQVNDSGAPILRWTGALSSVNRVTISYNVTVTQSNPRAITNTAVFDAGSAGQYNLSATIIVNGESTYMPVVRR
jgi:uncharacterized repeat protein (TIGR01451 family)